MRLNPGSRLGTYEVVGSLGAGGMGEVYRAKDLRLGRQVAIKVLPADMASLPGLVISIQTFGSFANWHPHLHAMATNGVMMPMPGMGPPLPYDTPSAATGFKLGGNPSVTPFLTGPVLPPDANETGWKDTFRMNPGEVTRILVRAAPQDAEARAAAMMPPVPVGPGLNLFTFEPWVPMGQVDAFGYPGGPGYVWHCHNIDHEDNEMMRQLMVLEPEPPTALLLLQFEAVPVEMGIRVSWAVPYPALFAALTLERGETEEGPWRMVEAGRGEHGGATVVIDEAVALGQPHWYRLRAVTRSGDVMTFGPVGTTARDAAFFTLGAVFPNPSAGAVRLDFDVPGDSAT